MVIEVLASSAAALTKKCPKCGKGPHWLCRDKFGDGIQVVVHKERRALTRITKPGLMVRVKVNDQHGLRDHLERRVA